MRELRLRQIRNALMYVFLSQGTPLLYAGDEQLNTQKGNNNAYCCDNPVGWLDWSSGRDSAAMTEFVKELTAYRRQNRIFHMGRSCFSMVSNGYHQLDNGFLIRFFG